MSLAVRIAALATRIGQEIKSLRSVVNGKLDSGATAVNSSALGGVPSYQIKKGINSVTNNLGDPSVEEMALFHGQFSNKLRFVPAALQEESADGVLWTTSSRASSNDLKDIMLGEGQTGGIAAIPAPGVGGNGYYRLTWDAAVLGYVFLNALYCYSNTEGLTVNIKIETWKYRTGVWSELVNGSFGNWPGHQYIPHNGLAFLNSPDAPDHTAKVRVTWSIVNAAASARNFYLHAIEWFGGYPAGRRNVEYYDRYQNVYFPATITGTKLASTMPNGTSPMDIISQTLVANLNADLLDGKHADTEASGNTIAARDANGYLKCTYINSNRGVENHPAEAYLFDNGDGWMRKKTLANARAELVTADTIVAGLGYNPAYGNAGYGAHNFDGYKQPGLYQYDGALSGTEPIVGGANWRTLEIGSGSRYSQMAFHWASDRAFFRRSDGAWSTWKEFWHSGNFDPATKAAANHGDHGLATHEGNSQAHPRDTRSLAVGAMAVDSALLSSNTSINNVNKLQYWNSSGDAVNNPNTGWHYGIKMGHGDADTYFGAQLAFDFFNDNISFRRRENNVLKNWVTLWHTGNFSPNSKADLFSPMLTGVPTTPTPATSDNSTTIANTAFVKAVVAALVASSPSTLDTLNELAVALGNDPNFATTMTNALAGKLSLSGGTLTGQLRVNRGHAFGANDYDLELYAEVGSEEVELSMRFHQGGRYYNQIRVRADGFRFTTGADNTLVPILAANIFSNGNLVWNAGNFDPATKAAANHGDHGLATHEGNAQAHPRDTRNQVAGSYETAFGKNTAFNKNFGINAGEVCQGNDARLSDARTPTDTSVVYAKLAAALKQKNTVTSSVDLSANGIGTITLSANTAFSFSGFELNKTYLLIITANGFTPSWSVGAKHVPVVGNAAFGTSGVFYVSLTCIDATNGSEKLLTAIMKGA